MSTNHLHPTIRQVSERIRKRSSKSRSNYLEKITNAISRQPQRRKHGCANQAHASASVEEIDKPAMLGGDHPNVAIVTAYNDMLSAHQPYAAYPTLIKTALRKVGALAQVAGGVPAMCDGITQGEDGMELSLFSRDVIAMSTAVALSHNTFDAALCLGVCDKIVPGLLIGALSFGHLPVLFIPAGPMATGLSNDKKSNLRVLYTEGKIAKDELLEGESQAYHSPGTCTFYGTANSNQMMMEFMGLHLPGASFVHPNSELRSQLTSRAAQTIVQYTALGSKHRSLGQAIDERAIVNAMVGLLATGGSTNHTIHLVAIARAAGILINWDDFAELSSIAPLLARIYPNGKADVNQFEASGGLAYVIAELLDGGLVHRDILTMTGSNDFGRYRQRPVLVDDQLQWTDERPQCDTTIIRNRHDPFETTGGLQTLSGNLGRAVTKTSAVPSENRKIRAPARIFHDQKELEVAYKAGKLKGDFVAVVRGQGPQSNGMPELHKLTPLLLALQNHGQKVALVTDGRMSGASGKVLAAIHLVPEFAMQGPIAKLRDGDPIIIDAAEGVLQVDIDHADWSARSLSPPSPKNCIQGSGRELFQVFRSAVSDAEHGASVLFDAPE